MIMTFRGNVMTDIIAAIAVTNSAWTDIIQEDLSIALTSVGLIWLLIQIYYKIKFHGKDYD